MNQPGLMMEQPLLLSDVIEHAAAQYGDVEVVSGSNGMRRVLLCGAGARPLLVDGLVSRTQVLVDQRRAEILGLDGPGHGLHPGHRYAAYFKVPWERRAGAR